MKYDLVVLSGVIYHAYDPLVVMMYARRLLKQEGLFIVESAYHQGLEPVLYINWDAPRSVPQPDTYFLPTVNGLHSLLRFCCCDPIATITNNGRVGVLARAKSPQTVSCRSRTLEMIFSKSFCYGPLDFSELAQEAPVKSDIRYTGRYGSEQLIGKHFTTTLPLQPKWQPEKP